MNDAVYTIQILDGAITSISRHPNELADIIRYLIQDLEGILEARTETERA